MSIDLLVCSTVDDGSGAEDVATAGADVEAGAEDIDALLERLVGDVDDVASAAGRGVFERNGELAPGEFELDEALIAMLALLGVHVHHDEGFVLTETTCGYPNIVVAAGEPLAELSFLRCGRVLPAIDGRLLVPGTAGEHVEAACGE